MHGVMTQYCYHTDPNSTLDWQIPDNNHLYGLEMEFLGSPDNPQRLANACEDRAILTEDGTVDGELVSVAMTAGEARAYLRRMVPALAGTTNDSKVGFHIHVSRTALIPSQWFRLAQFCAKHALTLEAIGGRPTNRWHDLRELPATSVHAFLEIWARNSGIMGDRYAGVNFTKCPTVEFRYNRATKTLSRALARFGAIQRLVALGRLETDKMPDQEQLRSWLAEDPHIRKETGWTPGLWQYPGKVRDQPQQHEHQDDNGPDQIAA